MDAIKDLDTRGLTIHAVATQGGAAVPFTLGPEDEILGRRLRLTLPAGCTGVAIRYETSPEAIGLQWLSPAQTEGKVHPFLFSQCQAIHARTLVPCQDCAVARVTYDAELTVPAALTGSLSHIPDVTGSVEPW